MNSIIIKQVIAGVVALAIFAGVVTYMFGHTKPVIAQAQITNVIMARGIDARGNPLGAAATFDPKSDRSVYAVIDLKNATRKTEVAYVRYFNGRYIDSKITLPSKDGVPTVFFNFEKGVGSHPSGNYTLVTYVNGTRGIQTNYTFKSGIAKVPARIGQTGDAALANVASAATATNSQVGKAAFVLEGTVASSTAKVMYLQITNASKNLLALKGKSQNIPMSRHTHVTKNGKTININQITAGTKVKVFGIYDKKSSTYADIQWIKIQ